MSVNYMHFPDLTQFLDYVMPVPAIKGKPGLADLYRSWDSNGGGGFFGCKSFPDAKRVLDYGWPHGSSRVLELRAELDSLVQSASVAKASAMGWAHAGEWLHVGRAITGRPDCFARAVDTGNDTCDRVVTVAMNVSCSASTTTDQIFKRGAVTLCLVDILETLGHRVELLWGTCAKRTDAPSVVDEFSCVVKKPSEHIDIDRLAFLFCHRDAARRFAFRYYEHQGRNKGGLPSPMQCTATGFPGCVIVPEIKHPKTPQSVVADCLKAAGVTLEFAESEVR
jgi:hypothetical protein